MSLSITAPRPSRTAAPLRLTRRGRFLFLGLPVLLLGAGLLVSAFLVLATGTAHAGTETAAQVTESRMVGTGESLWEIALDVAPESDPRETMTFIAELNGLDSAEIVPGQMLIVPVIESD